MRYLLALVSLFIAASAYADCSGPVGQAGSVIFNSTYNVMQYCNGTNWFNTGVANASAAQTGCTSPAGTAGAVIFNASQGVVQFCNGSSWVDTACAATRQKNGSGCTSPTGAAGKIQYVASANELQFCDSTNWVAMGWPCATGGLTNWSLATQLQKVTGSDTASVAGRFGASVSLSGTSALIGAWGANGNGAAYVFTRSGSTWSQQAKLLSSDLAASDTFGYSVAIDGNTAVLGAYNKAGTYSAQGAAYVFTRSGTTWSQQAKLLAGDPAASDRFGSSVAIAGDTVLIGAYTKAAAYVFTRSGTTWSQQAKLTPSDTASQFGFSVALSGDTALIGAQNKVGSIGPGQGGAYIFTRSGTTWSQQANLTPSDTALNDYFGYSVALDGDTALIGAYTKYGTYSGQGAAYIYTRSGSTWSQQAELLAGDPAATDKFGASVALYSGTALIGAYTKTGTGGTNQGAAYIFTGSGASWTQKNKFVQSDPAASDNFGNGVALSADTALVGAPQKGGSPYYGAGYFYGQ